MLSYAILSTTFIMFFLYMGVILYEKSSKYFTRTTQLQQVENKYEQLCKSRREMLQHYYWAQSAGEKEKEKSMEKQILKTDDELAELRRDFESLSAGKKVPLKQL